MTYYILPKNIINYNVFIRYQPSSIPIHSFLSYSFHNYDKNIKKEFDEKSYIETIIKDEKNPFIELNLFFELYELIYETNIVHFFTINKKINICCFTNNKLCCNMLFKLFRYDLKNDDNFMNHMCFDSSLSVKEIDIFIFDVDTINKFLLVLLMILKYQKYRGLTIIKISNIIYKPVIDIIYILTTIFERVQICKPSISNAIKQDNYLVCSDFISNNLTNNIVNCITNHIINDKSNICSIIDNSIPIMFLNKIEEYNAIIGQQYLESTNHIINILNTKNNNDKIEVLKRNYKQKYEQWCDKNNLSFDNLMEGKTYLDVIDNIINKIIDK
jgi:predicted transcriptional regulator